MKDGFLRVAVATPNIKVADCKYNSEQIINLCKEASGAQKVHERKTARSQSG